MAWHPQVVNYNLKTVWLDVVVPMAQQVLRALCYTAQDQTLDLLVHLFDKDVVPSRTDFVWDQLWDRMLVAQCILDSIHLIVS